MPRLLLVILSAASFLVTTAGVALAPFLLEMARDLRVDLAAVANLVAVSSVTWGVMSLVAGTASDCVGRRPILVAAGLTMGAARVGLGLARS